MFIAVRDRRFQVNPAAMQRAGSAAAAFRVGFSIALSLALKRGGEARNRENRLQVRVTNAFRGFEGFD